MVVSVSLAFPLQLGRARFAADAKSRHSCRRAGSVAVFRVSEHRVASERQGLQRALSSGSIAGATRVTDDDRHIAEIR